MHDQVAGLGDGELHMPQRHLVLRTAQVLKPLVLQLSKGKST